LKRRPADGDEGEIQGITVIDDTATIHGNPRHSLRAEGTLSRSPPGGDLSAAPLHPHAAVIQRVLGKLQGRRPRSPDGHLSAGEKPIRGVSTESILKPLKKLHSDAEALPSSTAPEKFREQLAAGDVVLTLGAGDVWKFGEQLLKVPASRP